MIKREYTLSELKNAIKESTQQEFDPVLGDGVERGNKENNRKALKDINKEVSKYDGGLTFKRKTVKIGDNGDMNKTTLDVDFDDEPSDEYKKRVKAQVHGYPSEENEKSHKNDKEEDKESFEGNKNLYKGLKDRSDKINKDKQDLKASGLQAREFDKDKFKTKDIYKENKEEKQQVVTNRKMKILNFKKTTFLNEEDMMRHIPDEYKTDGNTFKIKDKNNRTFIVEWTRDDDRNMSFGSVKEEKDIKAEFAKMKHLWEYKSSDSLGTLTKAQRVNESKSEFNAMLNKAFNGTKKKMDEWNEKLIKESKNRPLI